jgi:hypothetical protein
MLPIFLAASLSALAAVELDSRTQALTVVAESAVSRPSILASLGRDGLDIKAPGFALTKAGTEIDSGAAPKPIRWSNDFFRPRADTDLNLVGELFSPAWPARPITLGEARSIHARPPFALSSITPGYGKVASECRAVEPRSDRPAYRTSSR